MALNLISKTDTNNKGVTGLADTPGLTASAMQKKFDELSTDVIIPKFNENVNKLNAEDGANEITMTNPDSKRFGTGAAKGIATVLRKIVTDLYALSGKYMTPVEGLNAKFDEKANIVEFNAFKTDINAEVSTFEETVNSTVADISHVADTANSNSENAISIANGAVNTADNAFALSTLANTNSENAVNTANDAKATVDSFESAVEEAKRASAEAATAAEEAKEAAEEASRSAVKIDDTQTTTYSTYSSQKIEDDIADVTHFNEVGDLSGEVPGFNARTLSGHTSDFFAEKNEVDMALDMEAIPEELGPTVGGAISTLLTKYEKQAITFSSSANYKIHETDANMCCYIVHNGICYVNLSIDVVSPTQANSFVVSGLPKPRDGFHFATLGGNNTSSSVFAGVDSNGRIGIKWGVANINYLGSFAYPCQ